MNVVVDQWKKLRNRMKQRNDFTKWKNHREKFT